MGKYDHLKTGEDIDSHLCADALSTLEKRGVTAIGHLYAHPMQSRLQLARLLKSVSARGLVKAIYYEALRESKVRAIAKELLFREIIEEYPEGWTSFDEIGPIVNLGTWITTFELNVKTPREVESANRIYTDITRDALPPEGWKPESADDPYLVELFDRNWPVETH